MVCTFSLAGLNAALWVPVMLTGQLICRRTAPAVFSDGVWGDMSLASRVLEDTKILGLGLVKFPVTHRCTDTAVKKVLMIRAKTVISVSSFLSWRDVTTLVMRFCHTSSLTWRPSTGKGRHGTDFWVYAVCPWPWPCHLCPWLHHWQS